MKYQPQIAVNGYVPCVGSPGIGQHFDAVDGLCDGLVGPMHILGAGQRTPQIVDHVLVCSFKVRNVRNRGSFNGQLPDLTQKRPSILLPLPDRFPKGAGALAETGFRLVEEVADLGLHADELKLQQFQLVLACAW